MDFDQPSRQARGINRPVNGRTDILVLQASAPRDIVDTQDVHVYRDHLESMGCGYAWEAIITADKPGNVDRLWVSQHLKRIHALIQQYKPKVLLIVGPNLMKGLNPELQTLSNNKVRGYIHDLVVPRTKFRIPALCVLPPATAATYMEFGQIPENMAKLKLLAEGRGYYKEGKVVVLREHDEIVAFLHKLKHEHKGWVAFDTETRNLNKVNNTTLCSMQFAVDDNTGYVIYWTHPYNKRDRARDQAELRPLLIDLFSGDSNIFGWVMHNAQFDLQQMRAEFGVMPVKPVVDTMLLLHMMDQSRNEPVRMTAFFAFPYSLKQSAIEFLGFRGYEDEALAARKDGNIADLPEPRLSKYAGQDGFVTFRLLRTLIAWAKHIDYDKKLMRFAMQVHSPALKTFAMMSMNGMNIDRKHLETLKDPSSPMQTAIRRIKDDFKVDPVVQAINQEIFEAKCNSKTFWEIPWVFDIAKATFRNALFFHSKKGRQYPPVENIKTKKAEYSCAKIFQNMYRKTDPLVALLSEATELAKLNSAYVTRMSSDYDNAKLLLDDLTDGKVHCQYQLHGTQTGRLSAVRPNMQQIPRAESPLKTAIKNIFTLDPQGVIAQADFAAAEVRMWGSLSGDEYLCQLLVESVMKRSAYRADPTNEALREEAELMADIHKQTAALMFGLALKDVTKPIRSITKSIVFGLIYGRGIPSIAEQLGKTVEETEELCKKFFAQFPGGAAWLDEMKAFCKLHGYIETPFGRRRYLPMVFSEDRKFVEAALRRSINTPVQSTTGDFATLSIALLNQTLIDRRMTKHFWLVNAVHDSTLVRIPRSRDALAEIVPIIRDAFTVKSAEVLRDKFGYELRAPMDIDMEVAQHWTKQCVKCGETAKAAYVTKCKAPVKGPDGKPLKDDNDKEIACGCEDFHRVELNGGWGTLIGVDETQPGYTKAALGF